MSMCLIVVIRVAAFCHSVQNTPLPSLVQILEINKSLVGYQRKIFERGKTVVVLYSVLNA